jgi:S1-C subfamily serine protease/HSP20 family molecular chaperone IbpA
MKKHILLLTAVFLCMVSCAVMAANQTNNRETPVVKVVKDNGPVVVNISTEHTLLLRDNPFWGSAGDESDLLFEQFFGTYGYSGTLKLKSVGSGVILDKDGLIVTNAHVVHRASGIIVILSNGTQVAGELVYENRADDLALVKISSPDLVSAKLGKSGDLMIGETTVAIGNPLGLENSVTVGVVSGKDRQLYISGGEPLLDGLIQTDAPINAGNSGGALFNLDGELIGINVAMVADSQGIGFAIPVEKIQEAFQSFKENRGVTVKQRVGLPKAMSRYGGQEGGFFPPETGLYSSDHMQSMRSQADRMLTESFKAAGRPDGGMFRSEFSYDADFHLENTKDAYLIKMDIASINKDKINVDINEDYITVSGEYSGTAEKKQEGTRLQVSQFGAFSRTLPMPEDADVSKISTKKEANTLIIRIPRKKIS